MDSTKARAPVKGRILQFGRALFLQVEDAADRLLMAPVELSDLRSRKTAAAVLERRTGVQTTLPARRWQSFVDQAWVDGEVLG